MPPKRKQAPLVPELPLSNKKVKPVSVSNDDDEEERKAEYRRQEQEKARKFIQGMMGTPTPSPSSSKEKAVKAARKPTPNKPSPTKPTPTPKKKAPPREQVRSTTPPLPSSPELLSPSELKKLRMDELRAGAAEDYMRQSRQQTAKVSGVLKAEPVAPPRRVAVAEPFVAQTASVTKAKASFLSRTDSVRSNECDAALVPTADETAWALRPKTVQFVVQVAGLAVLIWLVQTGHFDVRHLRTFSSAYRYVVPVCVSLGIVLLLFCFGLAVRQLLLVDYSNPQKNYENLMHVISGLTALSTLVTVLRDLFLSSRKE